MIRQLIRFALFTGLTLSLTVWIGLRIAAYESDERYALEARFDDVTGLFPGDDVKLSGVQIGKVSSITFDHGQALVRFEINADIELPTDSQVAVRWRNLIGQRYLYLYEGTGSDMLPTDGSAEVERSTQVTDITDLVNTLGPLFSAVDPEQLNDVFETLVLALEGNGDNVDGLVVDLNSVVGALAERDETLQQLLGDYATITGELATRDQQIETMVDNLVLLSQTFADNTELVDRALVELGGFAGDLDALLTANEGHLASILGNLSLITGTAVANLDDLEAALQNLPAAVQDLFSIINDGEFLNINVPCLSVSPPPGCVGLGQVSVAVPVGGTAGTTTITSAARPDGPGVPLDAAGALADLLFGSLGAVG